MQWPTKRLQNYSTSFLAFLYSLSARRKGSSNGFDDTEHALVTREKIKEANKSTMGHSNSVTDHDQFGATNCLVSPITHSIVSPQNLLLIRVSI